MDILLRQVRLIDPSSPFHQQQADIFIQNGQIVEIGSINRKADQVIDLPGLHVSAGWVDLFAHFQDPGFEYKETLETGARAAAAGGYTDVLILPNTSPALHNKSSVEYIVQRSRTLHVNIHPIAAISKNTEGKDLAEMYDMHASGAVAFSDGLNTIQSSGLMVKALQYLKAINKTVIQLPEDCSISGPGLMNEGVTSTRMGLPGKPDIAEELMIVRDIELARYTDSKLHITGISTAKSVALIQEAKKQGVQVTCSVTPYHLFFTEEDLAGYDTNLKVNPPLRTKKDQNALKEGLMNGAIDCIASHHLPQDKDHKVVEFEYAHYGMIGLETSFAAVKTALSGISEERLTEIFSSKPREIFELPQYSINNGSPACLSLFLPDQTWKPEGFQSKSINSAFKGIELKGKPVGIINKDRVFLNL